MHVFDVLSSLESYRNMQNTCICRYVLYVMIYVYIYVCLYICIFVFVYSLYVHVYIGLGVIRLVEHSFHSQTTSQDMQFLSFCWVNWLEPPELHQGLGAHSMPNKYV